MSKKKPELIVGQIVYIEESCDFYKDEPSDPVPYEVTKINSKSIYARRQNGSREYRFDKSKWEHKTGFGYTKYIWLRPQDYWDAVKRAEDKKVLRSRIAGELSNLSLEQLSIIAGMLNIKIR
ncbi:beta barrel domain-containing protein [Bacillus sp. JJ722]|uniref:beta barrel domain-containing protein n=1 Tax=Bacillus sp. JJ722 TaxID=3122973 RepID=UPI002FFE2F67